MICVYTSIMNAWDNLRPPAVPVDEDVRYICFTNLPNLPRVFPWEYRPAYPVAEPFRNARLPKILPHLMLPEDTEYSIYHDGNFQLRMDPHIVVKTLLESHNWAVHRHPCRICIYQESEILLRENIGTRELIEREIAGYRAAAYPEGSGLWANGMIVRRHTGRVAELNELWWTLYAAGCERDQLSFPVARRDLDFQVNTIDADVWSSPYLLFNWHAAFKMRDDNPDFFPQRGRIRSQLSELERVTGSNGGVRFPEY